MFLLWLRQLPQCVDRTPASVLPPAEGRSSDTNTLAPTPIPHEFLHSTELCRVLYILFQVLLSTSLYSPSFPMPSTFLAPPFPITPFVFSLPFHFVYHKFHVFPQHILAPCKFLHVYLHTQSFSCVQLYCDPMACSPLGSSVHGILKQEYWSGLLFLPPGHLPNPGIKPVSLVSPALAGKLFTTGITWEDHQQFFRELLLENDR